MKAGFRSQWAVRAHPRHHAAVRLLCFPYAGAGASLFLGWSNLLPAWIDVWAVQLPGRENRVREAPYVSVPELVPVLGQSLLDCTDMPFAFFGHSLGALLAFEVCRFFRNEVGREPVQLLVSGHAGPQLPYLAPHIHGLADAELVQELRRYQATPEAVLQNPELLAMVLPVMRADFALLETYSYDARPPFSFPITAFAGLQDPEVGPPMVEAWQQQTVGTFRLVTLPGGHFFLQTAREALLRIVAADLESSVMSRSPHSP
jgi:medium-chain acyl-[acyl-carrier-protein] hydrolase